MNANRSIRGVTAIAVAVFVLFVATQSMAVPPAATSSDAKSAKPKEKDKPLRDIRVAVFNIDIQGIDIQPNTFRVQPGTFRKALPRPGVPRDQGDAAVEREWQEYERRMADLRANEIRMNEIVANDPSGQGALTDQINVLLAEIDKVTIVNRDQIRKLAEEHQIALSGLADTSSAVKLGKFLSAQYIVVGRASKIGQTYYLVLKIVDVETTEQTTVSAKAPTEDGFAAVLTRLDEPLTSAVRKLQRPRTDPTDTALAELRKLAAPLLGKVVLVSVEETHVGRPLVDPAAQMAIMQRLRSLGVTAIVPKDPVDDWKESLLQTGRYGKKKVDYLLEGEGTSAYAAQLQGLTSCRARVELRLIAVPGREITTSDRGVAAGVDLVESLAAKAALEEAGTQACDAVVRRWAAEGQAAK